MSQLLKQVVITVFGIYAFMQAIHYGNIWELQVHPMKDVEITTTTGEKFKGDVTRDWSGNEVLILPDGTRQTFGQASILVESWPLPEKSASLSITDRWRDVFLPSAVLGFFLLLSVWVGFKDYFIKRKG